MSHNPAILASIVITTAIITVWPMSVSNKVQKDADRIRFSFPDQTIFLASGWGYLLVAVYSLLPAAAVVYGAMHGWNVIFVFFGIVGFVLSGIGFASLKKHRVTFGETSLRHQALFRDVNVDYSEIRMAYASNGFIVIKRHDNKGVVIEIDLEKPGKLLATIKFYANQARRPV